MAFHCHSGDAANSGNRSNLAILPVTFRGRVLSGVCDNQQGAYGPMIIRQKRNAADTRPWVKDWGTTCCSDGALAVVTLLPRTPHTDHVAPCPIPRSRVLTLLIVARGRGNTRVMLTVADSAGARPREDGTERWPTFCDLRCFATNLKSNQHQ